MKQKIINHLLIAAHKVGLDMEEVELTPPKGHGDFSTNLAMKVAKKKGINPLETAQLIIANFDCDIVERLEVAGPGFINIFLTSSAFASEINRILAEGESYGQGKQNKFINVEYVSANPTGFLHLGHARGAVFGSVLVELLRFAGNKVDSEYYVNDAGKQIDILGLSAFIRYQNALGVAHDLPTDSYRGDDIKDCAQHLVKIFGDVYQKKIYEDYAEIFKSESKKYLLEIIKDHLAKLNVHIEFYSSEQEIYTSKRLEQTIQKLKEVGATYEADNALWLNTSAHGDDKDRVLIKSDGTYTYLAPDIAYHDLKLSRGYDELINIWGADHIGYIKRMEVAIGYLGLPKESLDIIVMQLVKLTKNGQELKMSKRAGVTFTLLELVEEIGVDAARWFLIDRSNLSEIVFDVEQATSKTNDNPVFSVQYAHARCCQLLEKSGKKAHANDFQDHEKPLINVLLRFPEVIESASRSHKVHLLSQYLLELVNEFNSWYSNSKAIGDVREESLMALVASTKQIIASSLKILGISSPNKM